MLVSNNLLILKKQRLIKYYTIDLQLRNGFIFLNKFINLVDYITLVF